MCTSPRRATAPPRGTSCPTASHMPVPQTSSLALARSGNECASKSRNAGAGIHNCDPASQSPAAPRETPDHSTQSPPRKPHPNAESAKTQSTPYCSAPPETSIDTANPTKSAAPQPQSAPGTHPPQSGSPNLQEKRTSPTPAQSG